MTDEILDYHYSGKTGQVERLKDRVLASGDPREMFLYLFYVDNEEVDLMGKAILDTGNFVYIHYLLRSFRVTNYKDFIQKILCSDSPKYLFNILYDVDYLDKQSRLEIIQRIIELNDDSYITKAAYYYFVVLDLFDEGLSLFTKNFLRANFSIEVDNSNYKGALDKVFYRDDYKKDPDGFSMNCFEGRNGYIPSLIVCHINNSYSSAIKRFYDTKSGVSSHYVIRRDGHVKQVVGLDDSAWANGTSLDPLKDYYNRFATSEIARTINDNANYFSFSIEHESFDGNLTDEQLNATVMVMREIIAYLKDKYNYDFQIDRKHIIGHNEVNPVIRKKCPGEGFPFDKIIRRLKHQ
ncbi:N-acetylmuramoyl-L-alanine amidase [Candidatus Saccharibacteria bacterium]|nr:N-acetylmuramoyl-L-alanine amidase [Candidatus Saccharibacteria bacterium]